MSAILQEIRRLESARDRGELSEAAFDEAKEEILNAVEEATVISQSRPSAEPQGQTASPADTAQNGWFGLLAVGAGVTLALTSVVGQLIGDFTLALTLMVSILAAIVFAAARKLEG
ncbi:SHOCT domain-containing protein [Phaeobacter sp.]|uniref:SHOCT domain-containing protein n=1 Tax=Phaeobacter sp. TaxID=1902409 RepID=UPI0025E01122|nr:SHOCT domain-containing protein [Phaeobacter sp.]